MTTPEEQEFKEIKGKLKTYIDSINNLNNKTGKGSR